MILKNTFNPSGNGTRNNCVYTPTTATTTIIIVILNSKRVD